MQVTGRIKMISQTQEVSQSFRKRELVVTTEEQYPQHILIEFHQDKCDVLNSYQIGQQVAVDLNLRGREWVNPQGETKYFNTIQGWRITAVGMQQQPMQPQSFQQPQYGQPGTTGYHQPQHPPSTNNGGYNQQPQQGYGQQQGDKPPF